MVGNQSAGISLDGFSTLTRIGVGGLGDVYHARRLSTGAAVAIKVLRDWSDTSAAWNRAQRELSALVGLQGHPHVIHVEDVVDWEGVPLIVMEFAPGGSVADLLAAQGTISAAQAILIGEQVSSALLASPRIGWGSSTSTSSPEPPDRFVRPSEGLRFRHLRSHTVGTVAGVDVVVFTSPAEADSVIAALTAAVNSGQLPPSRIDDAARKVLGLLESRGGGCR